jgi:hypothetical protein
VVEGSCPRRTSGLHGRRRRMLAALSERGRLRGRRGPREFEGGAARHGLIEHVAKWKWASAGLQEKNGPMRLVLCQPGTEWSVSVLMPWLTGPHCRGFLGRGRLRAGSPERGVSGRLSLSGVSVFPFLFDLSNSNTLVEARDVSFYP